GDSYEVIFEEITDGELCGYGYDWENDIIYPLTCLTWQIRNSTTGDTLLPHQKIPGYGEDPDDQPIIDGFRVKVNNIPRTFTNFEVIANAAGPIEPTEPGALFFGGFPVPTEYDPDGYISERQQATADGQWGIHTADNGGTTGAGTRGGFDAFLARTTRDGGNWRQIIPYDFEMRFTGSNANPGVEGGVAIEAYNDDNVFWVPFELW
ncbi:MAG: hypothetical protein GY869_29355, partial [Planctomycetes bacterium]|nr:hypothetical protein [Planctomycetota bacterium]